MWISGFSYYFIPSWFKHLTSYQIIFSDFALFCILDADHKNARENYRVMGFLQYLVANLWLQINLRIHLDITLSHNKAVNLVHDIKIMFFAYFHEWISICSLLTALQNHEL